jgi:MipA family protein
MHSAVRLFCAVFVALGSTAAHAELPRWELGLGLGGVSLPEYRGSDQQQNYLLPIPYMVYRGERFVMDRRGMRGLLFASESVALDISGDLGVPVNSRQNGARTGMPNLDFMLHLGPSLEFTLHEERDHGDVLKIKLPAQAVISMNLSEPGTHGWFFYPHVNYIIRSRWTLGTAFGPTFATRDYHQYYYGVRPAYATTTRPEYSAGAGYSGLRMSASLSRRIGDVWLGVFARYENFTNSVFTDSPLVRSNDSLVTGFGAAWIFLRSDRSAADTPLSEPDTM